ncbi:hypothetical protein U27_01431 [Candidatus Vecturithrix granuli]|uniref:Uncharacterized protein n=1 Tax=Vecturithrix granuli TaxID=1499967 RepID=A0A081CAC5_VECG1|nr:hypothetical protein U27_01431 [Candidatus Vecturithrix granuli]
MFFTLTEPVEVKTLIKPWKGLKLIRTEPTQCISRSSENPNKTLEGIKTRCPFQFGYGDAYSENPNKTLEGIKT